MSGETKQSIVSRLLHFQSVHPSNTENTNSPNDLNDNPLTIVTNLSTTPTIPVVEPISHSSSAQSLPINEENSVPQNSISTQLITNLLVPNPPSAHKHPSLFAKLTDAKKSLFGRASTPDTYFSSAEENRALLNYILSEPNPQLDVIQEYERSGAQLNAITDEGNTAIQLLARAENHTIECINIIDYLTKKGCDPNRQNDYGWTAVHYALATCNAELAFYLLKVMIDVNLPTFDTHNGYPSQTHLLHIAARQNDSVLIRLLIKTYRARVNVFNEDGCTPLHICCYENNLDALKALLENDADFQKGVRLNQNDTPLSICVKYQHDQCLKSIFDLANNFNWKRYFSQITRSPLLCDFPSVYAIELLVEHGLDINACDDRGNTLFHCLVSQKDIDYEAYIDVLIRTAADFNRRNRFGRTPFLEALEQKNLLLLAVLLLHIESININTVDSLGNTALHYCKYLDELAVYQTILKANPLLLNAQNRDEQTPLHEATLCDNYTFVKYLLQKGATTNIPNKEGNIPLHLTARDDKSMMCRLLMKQPLDLVAVNKMGKTPLHLACANEKPTVAEMLIKKLTTEQMNLIDKQGRTPLHECAENLDGSLAKHLIRHGADENAQDAQNNNVLHLATEKGNIKLVETLIKSSKININKLNDDKQSPLTLAILYNHDDVSKYLLREESISIQATDLKMAMQMSNYEMVRLLCEKDHNCLRVRSSTYGDMIIHMYMRQNFNNLVCLETLLSFISDNELLSYLTESSLTCGDNLLHIAARDDTPNALACFLNLSRVKFWFWANMMLTKNHENKTPMELANEFKHYAIIKLINSKWKESYEYLSHSLRDGHCGVSPTGVTQAKRQCFNCKETGFVEIPGQAIRPCTKCNVCLYKSLDNSMQIFLALLFSDESSTIALDIMDSLIVINEVQKAVHLYLDHIEPWEEFDQSDPSGSSSLLSQLIYTTDHRKKKKPYIKDSSAESPLVQMNSGSSMPSISSQGNNPNALSSNPDRLARPSITAKFRPDGTCYRAITPLEALYYHERLDLVTHPLIKGLIKWKWDKYASKHFYLGLGLEVVFLILWTCVLMIGPFPIRHSYNFPHDSWRCILWILSISFWIYGIIKELLDMSYARKRYEDYLVWETERKQNRLYVVSKNKDRPNTTLRSTNPTALEKTANPNRISEHNIIDETNQPAATTTMTNVNIPGVRSHHSQHHPLPYANPATVKGKISEVQSVPLEPIDAPKSSSTSESKRAKSSSRCSRFCERYRKLLHTRFRSYYMYYSLNNLFDWITYILCLITFITHMIDVGAHTVTRARIHMYIASVTVICLWFRFMVFFRTISISAKTLRSKLVEIKLGELVIMVRMMFDDIIRFLLVFVFLLAPYAFVFSAVFGGKQIIYADYQRTSELCESALMNCQMVEVPSASNSSLDLLESRPEYKFEGSSAVCLNATDSCRIIETSGFETFYALLFTIFRIALVDEIPIDSFNLIDHYFAAFVCATYLLFTAILSINIFIGLISNALQTEAFSTVEARFLLERIEVILNYEWRLSDRRRLQVQETIHRQCAPLQLNWKEINFDAFGQTREEQQAKAFANFRHTIEKHNIQFDTFRIQVQQKLNDIDSTLVKLQSSSTTTTTAAPDAPKTKEKIVPNIVVQKTTSETPSASEPPTNVLEELTRLRELVEEHFVEQTEHATRSAGRLAHGSVSSTTTSRPSGSGVLARQQSNEPSAGFSETQMQAFSHNINERVTDVQLSVNRLHQDITSIRQSLERISPLSTSLILGRSSRRK